MMRILQIKKYFKKFINPKDFAAPAPKKALTGHANI